MNYGALKKNLTAAKMFIIPVKKEGGHYLLVSQYQDNSVMFTFADEYKKKGIFANPFFILTTFEELLETKKIALVRGDIIDFTMDKKDAHEVTKNLLSFYLTPELYEKYVIPFNNDSGSFSYENYCSLLNISAT